ncbi:unnamed protein product [Sphagnum jensenii]|uniref:Lipoprotein n=1 Tax=Sphagnum jensenii TaxID=128206 RepID=A0ABP0VAD3_9BRYO
MTTSKLLYTSIFGAFLLAGCNDTSNKLSQAEQKELSDLRTEKTAWTSEKAKMQESLEFREKSKNEALSELSKIKEELKSCQEKQVAASEAKPADKGKK